MLLLFVIDLGESEKDQINCSNNFAVLSLALTRMATNKPGDQEIPNQTKLENTNSEVSPQIEEIDVAYAGESDRFAIMKFNHLIFVKFFSLAGKLMMKEIFILNR